MSEQAGQYFTWDTLTWMGNPIINNNFLNGFIHQYHNMNLEIISTQVSKINHILYTQKFYGAIFYPAHGNNCPLFIWENINPWKVTKHQKQKANAEKKLTSIKDLSHESIDDNACWPLPVERIPWSKKKGISIYAKRKFKIKLANNYPF